jgi:hypothetical protein
VTSPPKGLRLREKPTLHSKSSRLYGASSRVHCGTDTLLPAKANPPSTWLPHSQVLMGPFPWISEVGTCIYRSPITSPFPLCATSTQSTATLLVTTRPMDKGEAHLHLKASDSVRPHITPRSQTLCIFWTQRTPALEERKLAYC